MIQMILEIDETTNVNNFSDELLKAMQLAKIQWPEDTLTGTKPVNGRKLILILSQVSGEELQSWIDNGFPTFDEQTGENRLIDFGVDWKVVAEENKPIDQSLLLPYFLPDIEYDDEGNVLSENPITDLTGRLQTWAGRQWTFEG